MTSRHRAAAAIVTSCLLLAVAAGCGDDAVDGSQAGRDLPECAASDCADEVRDFGRAVAALPDVAEVDVVYRAEQITAGASVTGDVTVSDGVDCATLEDDLGRLLWRSRINPVTGVTLNCYQPGATGADYEYARWTFYLTDAAELAAAWGPRGGG